MNDKEKIARKFFVGMVATALSINTLAATAFAADTSSHVGTAATIYTHEGSIGSPDKTVDGVVKPDATDRASIKIYGIDDKDAEVVAYHIIEANYNEFGVTGYTQTKATYDISDATKIKGFDKVTENVMNVLVPNSDTEDPLYNGGKIITEDNISQIAKAIAGGSLDSIITYEDGNTDTSKLEAIKLSYNSTSGAFETDKAEAGTYIVLVRNTTDGVKTVYNPMVVSNDYIDANDATSLGKDLEVRTGITADGQFTDYSNGFVNSEDGKRYRKDIEANGNVYVSNMIGDLPGDVDLNGVVNQDDVDALQTMITTSSTGNATYTDRAFTNADLDLDNRLTEQDKRFLQEYVNYLEAIKDLDPIKDYKAVAQAEKDNLSEDFPKDVLDVYSTEVLAVQGRAYAKKDVINFEKNIVRASTAKDLTDIDYSKYDDLRIDLDGEGEETAVTATFDIETEIPDYSDTYFASDPNFRFWIYDTLSQGLDPVTSADVVVYAASDAQVPATKANPTYAEDVAKYMVEDKSGNTTILTDGNEYVFEAFSNADGSTGYILKFNQAWVTSAENANKKIVVRYSTHLNDQAVKGLDGNPNDARLEFTTVPGVTDNIYDWTTHYTFPVWVTKVKENGAVEVKKDVIDDEDIVSDLEVKHPLEGAKFRIKKIKDINLGENGKEIITDAVESYEWTATSDKDGILQFDTTENGLDEGIYTLVEYEAPKGYTLNDKIYLIKITAEYDTALQRQIGKEDPATGLNPRYSPEHRFINKFTVTIFDDGMTGTDFLSDLERSTNAKDYSSIDWTQVSNDLFYDLQGDDTHNSIVYEWKDKEEGIKEVSVVATAIPNTQLSRLPSTGSVGTVVFTVGGIGIMSSAFLLARRRKAKKEALAAQNQSI